MHRVLSDTCNNQGEIVFQIQSLQNSWAGLGAGGVENVTEARRELLFAIVRLAKQIAPDQSPTD